MDGATECRGCGHVYLLRDLDSDLFCEGCAKLEPKE